MVPPLPPEGTYVRPARPRGSGARHCSSHAMKDGCAPSPLEETVNAKSNTEDAMQEVLKACGPRISMCSKAGGLRQDVDRLWQELQRTRSELSAACITPERVVRVVEVANAGLRSRLEELEHTLGEALGMQQGFAETLGVVQTHVEEMEQRAALQKVSFPTGKQLQSSPHDGSECTATSAGPSLGTSDISLAGDFVEVVQKLSPAEFELRADAVAQAASLESRIASAEASFNAGLKHIRGVLSTSMVDMAKLQPRVAELERTLSSIPALVPQTHVARVPSAAVVATAGVLEGGTGAALSKPNSSAAEQHQAATSQQQQQQQPVTPSGATTPSLMGAFEIASGPGSNTYIPSPVETTVQQANHRKTLAGNSSTHANVIHASSAVELGVAGLAQRQSQSPERAWDAVPSGSVTRMLDGIKTAGAVVGRRHVESRLLEAQQQQQQQPSSKEERLNMCTTYKSAKHQPLLSSMDIQKQPQQSASLHTLSTVLHQPRTPNGHACRDFLARGTRGPRDSRCSLPTWTGSPGPQSRSLRAEKEQQVVVLTRSGRQEDAQCARGAAQAQEQAPREASPGTFTRSAWPSTRSAASSSFVPAPQGSGVTFLTQSPQMQKRDITPTTCYSVTSPLQMARR